MAKKKKGACKMSVSAKVPLTLAIIVLALLGIALGVGLYNWQETSYDIGTGETQSIIYPSRANDNKTPASQPSTQKNINTNKTVRVLPVK